MLMRFDPFRDVDQFAEQVDQALRRGAAASIPMDAVRHGDRVFINFDLPGVDPDAIARAGGRDGLAVSATRRVERCERRRSVPLERGDRHAGARRPARRRKPGDERDGDLVRRRRRAGLPPCRGPCRFL